MISRAKGQKAVRACTIRLLNLSPVKHEEVAIYAVNHQIPNVICKNVHIRKELRL